MQGPEVAGREDLLTLLEAADLAFGAYKRNPQSLCAVTSLPVGATRSTHRHMPHAAVIKRHRSAFPDPYTCVNACL
jgi:hypothetical protein